LKKVQSPQKKLVAVTSATKKKTKTSKKEVKYRSGLERNVALDLNKRGISFQYEHERIPYVVERKYLPDFQLPNGIYIEAKGWFKDEDCRKMKLLKKQYPDKEFRFLFQNNNTKVQSKRFTNSQWCEKYDFKYCEGKVPDSWLKEKLK
jgi:hypothetical protein